MSRYAGASITAYAHGFENRFRVEVTGNAGTFTGTRRTFSDAHAVAKRYAHLCDAPRDIYNGGSY